MLFADDGTWCQVSRAKFRDVSLKALAACVWHPLAPADRRRGTVVVPHTGGPR